VRGGRGGDWETTVKRSILTPEGLRRLIDRYDRLEYKIMLDASFSGRFIDALKSSPRVRIIETSSAAAEVSFGHIRDGEVSDADGKEIRTRRATPDRAGEFTNGNVRGLETWAATRTHTGGHSGRG
jgi:hypothetical protein